MPNSWYLSVYQNIARISTYDNVVAVQLERLRRLTFNTQPFTVNESTV